MNFEKFTDRARGFVQSAQSLALREGHQQFAPEHLLKVLLDDPEGLAAGLIDRSGGNSRQALRAVEASLAKRRSAAAAQVRFIWIRRWRGSLTRRKRPARRPVTVSSLPSGYCLRSRWKRTARPEKSFRKPA
jgi:ATP-dependent Clp protease ATP-binding subunit ClpA